MYSSPDEQVRKIFIGGLNRQTDEHSIKEHFKTWGTIVDVTIMRDMNKISRGFAFILFESDESVDLLMQAKKEMQPFSIDGNNIDVKRAVPPTAAPTAKSKRDTKNRKLFVGGLPINADENHISDYFGQFGRVEEVIILRDKKTQRKRGFGFVVFEDAYSCKRCLQIRNHLINSKSCEVKMAEAFGSIVKEDNRYSPYDTNRKSEDHTGIGYTADLGRMDISTVNQIVAEARLKGFKEGLAAGKSGSSVSTSTTATTDLTANPLLRVLQDLLGGTGNPTPVPPPPPPPTPAKNDEMAQANALATLLLKTGAINSSVLETLLKKGCDQIENDENQQMS